MPLCIKRALGPGGNVVSWRQFALVTLVTLLASGATYADTSPSCSSIEKPFQEVIGSGETTRNTLANLNDRLDRYGWSLTRYTVRLLHELDAENLTVASERLRDDTYASSALRNAMWDGFNGWSIVSSLRAETLEVLNQLEAVRSGGADKALVGKAQKVTEWLLEAASDEEAVEPGSGCDRPGIT
jgi:hypothetical protein